MDRSGAGVQVGVTLITIMGMVIIIELRMLLLVLDDIAEMNCIIKYLMDEFPSQPATKYAIGLQTPDQYKGVYEWRTGMK